MVHANTKRNRHPVFLEREIGTHRSLAQRWMALGSGLLLCVFLLTAVSAGNAEGLPANVCHEPFCGPAQQEYWNRFQKGTALDLILVPSVYSGTCYHNSPSYDPDVPQFGGILIDKLKGHVVFDGRFSFYKQQHPYDQLSVDAARRRFPDPRHLALFDSFAYAEAVDSLKPFRYWLRQDPATGGLLLVGYFGYSHTMLCVLDRNAR